MGGWLVGWLVGGETESAQSSMDASHRRFSDKGLIVIGALSHGGPTFPRS